MPMPTTLGPDVASGANTPFGVRRTPAAHAAVTAAGRCGWAGAEPGATGMGIRVTSGSTVEARTVLPDRSVQRPDRRTPRDQPVDGQDAHHRAITKLDGRDRAGPAGHY